MIRQSGINSRDTILLISTKLLAYADDIDIVARTIKDLTECFIKIKETAKEIGLEINEEKIKAHISTTSRTRTQRIGRNLIIKKYNFEVVNTFTYLSTSINNENNISMEIKQRYLVASKCAYEFNKHLRSYLLSRKTKIKIYRTLIKPVLTYACKT